MSEQTVAFDYAETGAGPPPLFLTDPYFADFAHGDADAARHVIDLKAAVTFFPAAILRRTPH